MHNVFLVGYGVKSGKDGVEHEICFVVGVEISGMELK